MTNDAGASAPGDPQYSAPPVPPTAPPVAPPAAPEQYAPAPVSPSAPRPGGFDSSALQNFDPKTVDPKDWGIIAAGLLTFIFSLFSYYKYSFKFSFAGLGSTSSSGTVSAWHGFFGWFAALVALASALVLAANLIAKITLPFPVRLAVLGGFALALLCTLLALFIIPGPSGGGGFDKGHGFSYWVSWVLLLAGGGLSFLRFTETGGKLPSRS